MGWLIALAIAILAVKEMREDTPFDELFSETGKKWGFDPDLLKAIAKVESNFNPVAIGRNDLKNPNDDDYGLMQINKTNWKFLSISEDNWRDPRANINAAGMLLDDMRKTLKAAYNLVHIISAYNQGPGNLIQKGIQNLDYVIKVTFWYSVYSLGRSLHVQSS